MDPMGNGNPMINFYLGFIPRACGFEKISPKTLANLI